MHWISAHLCTSVTTPPLPTPRHPPGPHWQPKLRILDPNLLNPLLNSPTVTGKPWVGTAVAQRAGRPGSLTTWSKERGRGSQSLVWKCRAMQPNSPTPHPQHPTRNTQHTHPENVFDHSVKHMCLTIWHLRLENAKNCDSCSCPGHRASVVVRCITGVIAGNLKEVCESASGEESRLRDSDAGKKSSFSC